MQSAPPAGLFLNREVLAEFAAPLFVWAALRPRYWLLPIPALPLVLCQTRTAILAVGAGLFFAWYGRIGSLGRVAWLLAVGLALAGAFALRPETAWARLAIWQMLLAHLSVFGMGLGWFQASYPWAVFGHSDALQILAELGVPGLLLLAVPAVALWHGRGRPSERAMLATIGIEALVSFPAQLPAGGFVLAIATGFLARSGDRVRPGRDISWADNVVPLRRAAAQRNGGCKDSWPLDRPLPPRPAASSD
jgi:hypothetical protein